MKVKCINIYNEHTKQFEDSSSWLTIGKEYTVLEIDIYPEKYVSYRLVGDNENKMPALYAASQFETISDKVPTTWNIQLKRRTISISPKSWQELGFWEDCYDHDPKALEIYRREVQIIYEEEGMI